MVGQRRRAGAAPLRLPGGRLASRQGHPDDRQNRRRYVCRRDRIRRPTAQNTSQPRQGAHVFPRLRAEESKAAFIRARELAAAIEDATERFTIYYGLSLGHMAHGEWAFAREIAETFLREAE